MRVYRVSGSRIWIDSQLAQLGEAFEANALLFGSGHGETVVTVVMAKLGFSQPSFPA